MTNTVKRLLQRAVTVEWLLDELSHMPPDAVVLFACDYGDHCHTEQLLPVGNTTEFDPDEMKIYESAYSQSGLAVRNLDNEDDDYEDDGEAAPEQDKVSVVILNFQ